MFGYEYDSRGRQITVTQPDSTVVHMEYWPTGELQALGSAVRRELSIA